jgi:regulator of sigma E protease
MSIILLIIGIVLFIGLVVVHELGHFFVARRNGVEAEEFGIFFPPKIWSRNIKGRNGKKGFVFSINALPLGGFVRMKGEHDADVSKGSFGAATLWAKTKIMLAGVGMNLVVALILFMILAWIGMPQLIDNQFTVHSDTKVTKSEVLVTDILPNSPASKIGLQLRDQLLTIAPASEPQKTEGLSNADKLPDVTKAFAGQTVVLTYARNGQKHQATATLLSKKTVAASQKTNNPKGYLGITSTGFKLQRSTWSAPIVALGLAKQVTILTFKGLGMAVKGLGSTIAGLATGNKPARQAGQTQASSQVSGPVGIFVILKDSSQLGFQLMLMIVAVISLTLAIMNILPIPALDGGRLFVTYIARIFHRRVSKQVEDWVYGASFAFLLGLIALVTLVDVKRFF